MAKLLLGKEVTAAMNEKLQARVAALKEKGVSPKLAIVRCGENPSDLSYEKGATARAELIGVEVVKFVLPEDVTKEALIAQIEAINADDSIHGCLMFRPLPKHLKADQDEICNHLAAAKDVDCMTDLSNSGVFTGKKLGFAPCTPQACMEILDFYGIDCKGKNAVVIGRSLVVGKPAAMMLMAKNATVTVCHTKTVDVAGIARKADILVSAAGVLNSLTKEYVAPGQIVIDVSINWDPRRSTPRAARAPSPATPSSPRSSPSLRPSRRFPAASAPSRRPCSSATWSRQPSARCKLTNTAAGITAAVFLKERS